MKPMPLTLVALVLLSQLKEGLLSQLKEGCRDRGSF